MQNDDDPSPRQYTLRCAGGTYTLEGSNVRLKHGRPGAGASHGAIDDRGTVDIEMKGLPPRNEEGALEAAQRLVDWLNSDGARFGDAVEQHVQNDHVDALATSESGASLQIQVVRVANQKRWETLGRRGVVTESSDQEAVANELFHAIGKKAAKYATDVFANLTLVVDVASLPSHTFPQVIDALKRQHGAACRAYGFRAVFVVGSRPDLVFRIDA